MAITSEIKEWNRAQIRACLQRQQSASKSEISQRTNLSIPTVTRILEEMLAEGELLLLPSRQTTGGRNAALYALDPNHSLYLLVRLEGNTIHASVRDLCRRELAQKSVFSGSDIPGTLDAFVLEHLQDFPNIKSVMLGISAQVRDDAVMESDTFQSLRGISIASHFAALTPVPVHLENDMNAAAMGQWFNSPQKPSTSVCLYCGPEGIGAAAVHHGQLLRGAASFAGEVAYLPYPEFHAFLKKESSDPSNLPELFGKLCCIYAAILNPEQITIYRHPALDGQLSLIRKACTDVLPSSAMPAIEYSGRFSADYECGLYALAIGQPSQRLLPE